jgi:hypothetical protein
MTIRELLQLAADLGADFRESLDTRRVGATATANELRAALVARTLGAYAGAQSASL